MSIKSEGKNHYVLTTTSSSSTPKTVAAIAGFLAERDCYIMKMEDFDDTQANRFFTRTTFRAASDKTPPLDELRKQFESVATRYSMEWGLYDTLARQRVLIMVSKFDHCLHDLLYRQRTGELKMDVSAVVANHPDLEPIAKWYGVPFVHLPVTSDTKAAQEARLLEIVEETQSDLVVLARYMQILSDDLCRKLHGRAINIHHSFLPGFKGAKPYHQAYERGVKLTGATAHYVTGDLDEGPIIEQVVERVDHNYRPEDLVTAGRDSECTALARAVMYHIEHRTFINGNKTVVFR